MDKHTAYIHIILPPWIEDSQENTLRRPDALNDSTRSRPMPPQRKESRRRVPVLSCPDADFPFPPRELRDEIYMKCAQEICEVQRTIEGRMLTGGRVGDDICRARVLNAMWVYPPR